VAVDQGMNQTRRWKVFFIELEIYNVGENLNFAPGFGEGDPESRKIIVAEDEHSRGRRSRRSLNGYRESVCKSKGSVHGDGHGVKRVVGTVKSRASGESEQIKGDFFHGEGCAG